MGINYVFEVMCDHCSEWYTNRYDWTKRGAIESARKRGWSVGKTVRCPNCKRKPK